MPVVTTKSILQRAFEERYGVAAINVVNDLTMEAVLAAAEELRSPVIVQTSPKHVVMTGVGVISVLVVDEGNARAVLDLVAHEPARGGAAGSGRRASQREV